MIGLFERFARPLLRAMDPEDAHALALRALKLAPLPKAVQDDARRCAAGRTRARR